MWRTLSTPRSLTFEYQLTLSAENLDRQGWRNHLFNEFSQPLHARPLHGLSRDAALRYPVNVFKRIYGALDHGPFILQIDMGIIKELSAVPDSHGLLVKGNPLPAQKLLDFLA